MLRHCLQTASDAVFDWMSGSDESAVRFVAALFEDDWKRCATLQPHPPTPNSGFAGADAGAAASADAGAPANGLVPERKLQTTRAEQLPCAMPHMEALERQLRTKAKVEAARAKAKAHAEAVAAAKAAAEAATRRAAAAAAAAAAPRVHTYSPVWWREIEKTQKFDDRRRAWLVARLPVEALGPAPLLAALTGGAHWPAVSLTVSALLQRAKNGDVDVHELAPGGTPCQWPLGRLSAFHLLRRVAEAAPKALPGFARLIETRYPLLCDAFAGARLLHQQSSGVAAAVVAQGYARPNSTYDGTFADTQWTVCSGTDIRENGVVQRIELAQRIVLANRSRRQDNARERKALVAKERRAREEENRKAGAAPDTAMDIRDLVSPFTPGQIRRLLTKTRAEKRDAGVWRPQEVQLLRDGVDELGVGKWVAIRDKFLPERTPTQLKDKWKNLQRGQLLSFH